MEDLKTFVRRLSNNVGCYYHKNETCFSLKKYNTNQRGHMGVFGWVKERKTKVCFLVSTYKYLADGAGISDADYEKANAHYIPKGKDPYGKGTGLCYCVMKNSSSSDYQKVVRALKVIQRHK